MKRSIFLLLSAGMALLLASCSQLTSEDKKALTVGRMQLLKFKDFKSMGESKQNDFIKDVSHYIFDSAEQSGYLLEENEADYTGGSVKSYEECLKKSASGDEVSFNQAFSPCQKQYHETFFKEHKLPLQPMRAYKRLSSKMKSDTVRSISFSLAQEMVQKKTISPQKDAQNFMQITSSYLSNCLDAGTKDEKADFQEVLKSCVAPKELKKLATQTKALRSKKK